MIRTLTPQQAEGVVEDRLEFFGLGALPEIRVRALSSRCWRIWWTDRAGRRRVSDTPPMSSRQWLRWLEEYVGPTSPEMLMTTEG